MTAKAMAGLGRLKLVQEAMDRVLKVALFDGLGPEVILRLILD